MIFTLPESTLKGSKVNLVWIENYLNFPYHSNVFLTLTIFTPREHEKELYNKRKTNIQEKYLRL